MRNYDKGGMDAETSTQLLQSEFRESLDFLISLENKIDMTQFSLLKGKGIIDNIVIDKIDYVISRSKELKDGFECISFEDSFQVEQIRQCLEFVGLLKNTDVSAFNIVIAIGGFFTALRAIKMGDFKGNLNSFIYARN